MIADPGGKALADKLGTERGRIVKQPEANSSETSAGPDKDSKKKPVSGAAIDSRPIVAAEATSAGKSAPLPTVESTLVGTGTGTGAAARKPAAALPPKAEAAVTPGTVAKAETAKPADPQPAKPVSAQPEPAKPESSRPEPAKSDFVRTEPRPRVEPQVVQVRKAGFVSMVLGGIVAAGLGAAATIWAIPHLPEGWRPVTAAPAADDALVGAARDAGTEAARAEIQTQADAFAKRAAEAGADAARQALADAPVASGDAGAAQAQADKLAALEKAVSDLAARPAVAPVVSGDDSAGLQQLLNDVNGRLAAQQARIDELASRATVDPATAEQVQGFVAQAEALQTQIASAAAEAEQRIAAAETQANALRQTADTANRRAQAATAAAALQAAIETGGARDQALADLRAAGVEPAAVLTGDVATLEQLRAEFPVAARDGLAAAIKQAPQQGGAMGVIGDFLRVQTGARSVEPREGDDPDAVLSRADAAVKAGDIKGALGLIATLPQAGQDAMSGWTGKAAVWVQAKDALTALAAGSL